MRFKLLIYITIQTCAVVFHKGISISMWVSKVVTTIKESDNTLVPVAQRASVNSGSLLRRLEDFIHC